MLPAIALLITIYGCCRLANDVLKRIPPGADTPGKILALGATVLVAGGGIYGLLHVYAAIERAASSTPSLTP